MKKVLISLLVFAAVPFFVKGMLGDLGAEIGDAGADFDGMLARVDEGLGELGIDPSTLEAGADTSATIENEALNTGSTETEGSGLVRSKYETMSKEDFVTFLKSDPTFKGMSKEDLLAIRKRLIKGGVKPPKVAWQPTTGPFGMRIFTRITSVDSSALGSAASKLDNAVQKVDRSLQSEAGGRIKEDPTLVNGQEDKVTEEGYVLVSPPEKGYWEQVVKKGREAINPLNQAEQKIQKDINVLEEQMERRILLVTGKDGTVTESFLADSKNILKSAFGVERGLSGAQSKALKDALKAARKNGNPKADSFDVKDNDYDVKNNKGGSITVEATVNGEKFTYTLKNPTEMERQFLDSTSGTTLKMDANGLMTFSRVDVKLAQTIDQETKSIVEELTQKSEKLNKVLDELNKVEGPWNKLVRWKRNLKAGNSSIVVSIYRTIEKGFHTLVRVLETLSQAMLFNVPSIILQAVQAQAQQKALFKQIASPYEIAPGLVVQIPAQLISTSNPAGATFLYIAVAEGAPEANTMSEDQLKNGSYYVLYQSGYPWGNTYATAPGAPSSWINLNTGLIFMDQGVPLNTQAPFAYLLEPSNDTALALSQGAQSSSLSVQNYMEKVFTAVSGGQRSFYVPQSWMNIFPWTPSVRASAPMQNATISQLFAPLFANLSNDSKNKVAATSETLPPSLLVPTLNIYRAGIENVSGFLPATVADSAPAINIKQFVGIGALNRILGDPNSGQTAQSQPANVVETSLKLMLEIKQETLLNVVSTQKNLAKVLADADAKSTEIDNAVDAMNAAQSALAVAIDIAGSVPGLNPAIDLNAYNIYLYETSDTPIAQFLAQHRPVSFIAPKDYVVFLDSTGAIVPLFIAGFQKQGNIGQIALDPTQINSNITHMCSLISGLTYIFNSSGGPGSILLSVAGDGKPDFTTAQTAASTLFTQLTTVLKEGKMVINQISALANYATTLVSEGPYQKNNCVLSQVDFDDYTAQTPEDVIATIAEYLNGEGIPATAQNTTPFGTSALPATQSSWIDSVYIYKVAKFSSTDPSKLEGAFGQDEHGNPVYDYVVPLALVPSEQGTFQIMQLGMTALMGHFISNGSQTKVASDVQLMVSLITGQVYDQNYQLISGTTTVVQRNASFQPIAAQAGQYPFPWQTTDAQGNTTTVNVAAVPGLPLATAYMPTFCNPYNVIFTSLLDDSAYSTQMSSVNTASKAVQNAARAVSDALRVLVLSGNQNNSILNIWKIVQANAMQSIAGARSGLARLKSYFEPESLTGITGYSDAQTVYTAMQNWLTAVNDKNKELDKMKALVTKQQTKLKPPYEPVSQDAITSTGLPKQGVAIAKSESQILQIPPMYWLYFTNYVYCSMQPSQVSYTANNTTVAANLNWISVVPCASPSAFSSGGTSAVTYNLGQSLPLSFVSEVIRCFKGWSESQERNNLVAQVMQAGPFQFTNNLAYNTYLNLPPGSIYIGKNEIAQGNFFYTASPAFSSTELFVMGDVNSTTPPLTIANCNTGNRLGMSFLDITTKAIISISTGDVWVPTETAQATTCYASKETGTGIIERAMCNLTKIGTLDPQEVLLTALKNQQTDQTATTLTELLANLKVENPSLYAMIMNCQTLSGQQAQTQTYPFYFAGRSLRLCPQAGNIYAVVESPTQSYLEAQDYLIVIDENKNITNQPITPDTKYMMSLVSSNIFGALSQASITNELMQTYGSTILKTPQDFFEQMFNQGAYVTAQATPFNTVPTTNPALFNRIEELNQVINESYLQTAFQTNLYGNGIAAGSIPLADLQAATPVPGIFNNLYQVNGKYYLKIPGDKDTPAMWYDFNAGQVNPTYDSSAAQPFSYTIKPGNAHRGVYYIINVPDAQTGDQTGTTIAPTATATPISEITGYACQAMLDRFGITIDKDGNEILGLPVANPSLPMTLADEKLTPGESSGQKGNMQCMYSPDQKGAPVGASTTASSSYKVYYYVNNAAQMYLARYVVSTTIPVFNAVTNAVENSEKKEDFYVDLVTGEQYDLFGNPYLAPVSVAYLVATTSAGWPIPSPLPAYTNNDFDFSNPLFIWGSFDGLTGALTTQMLYQNTDSNPDPNNGYSRYSIQPYSTQFSLTTVGSSATPTVYAYGTATDSNGNPYITKNGVQITPTQIDMQAALLAAFNSGMYLLTKTYIMNLNGNASSSQSSSQLTVTETGINPVQYSISYTNGSGSQGAVTDLFQAPVTQQPVTGGSTNDYNNPPLDENLQNMLVQAKPFCATVLGSRPFGQTGSALTAFSGNSAPLVCGLLYQPAQATHFDLRYSGILGLTSLGFNTVNTSGGPIGQYFAFFDAYNGAPEDANGNATPTDAAPRAGGYSMYISVVSTVTNLYEQSAYPGLYAGSFTGASSFSSQQKSVAPYLCISSLTGKTEKNTTNLTEFTVPTAGSVTEYLYTYKYGILSDSQFSLLKDKVNISSAMGGVTALVSAINVADLQSVTIKNPELNPDAASMIKQYVTFARPIIPLKFNPPGRYLYKLSCFANDPNSVAVQPICSLLGVTADATAETASQFYIDIVGGIVFVAQTAKDNTQILYPYGFCLTGNLLNLISRAIAGACPTEETPGVLTIKYPGTGISSTDIPALPDSDLSQSETSA